jgi:hypothetical protein
MYCIIKKLVCAVLFVAVSGVAGAGLLTGTVSNEQGVAISHVSIYIKELTMGTSSNESGSFEVKIPDGTYTVSFLHLSYRTVTMTVTVPGEALSIKMSEKKYELPPAEIGKGENPAYAIIRKAMGMAPFYDRQLSYYKADVYIKGTMIIDKISGMVKMLGGKDLKKTEIKENEKYLLETVNEITYNNGKINHRIISESNSFPSAMGEVGNLGYLAGYNIYAPSRGQIVSPLSPEAFSYYRYLYEGFSNENDVIINKIKVIPKRQNSMTYEGYIYIVDDSWYVKELELSNRQTLGKITIHQNYGELQKNIMVPISFSLKVDISILGSKSTMMYVNSIKYRDFKVNPAKTQELFAKSGRTVIDTSAANIVVPKTSEKSKKLESQIEKLAEKEKMSNSDAHKMARLLRQKEKEDRKNLPDSLRPKTSLDLSDGYVTTTDSAARKHDSTYWANIRPIPLLNDERKSYVRKDSIKLEKLKSGTDSTGRKRKSGLAGSIVGGLLIGRDFYAADSTMTITYGGILDLDAFGFNLVDGLRIKQKVRLTKRFKDTTRLNAGVMAGYAFRREAVLFDVNAGYAYLPQKRARIEIGGGYQSRDFDSETGVIPFDNMLWNLFAHENYINYFNDAYAYLSHRIEAANGFDINAQVSYRERTQLHNNSNYSFVHRDREFKPNEPENTYLAENPALLADSRIARLQLALSYTPQMYYVRRGKAKRNVGSRFPTFGLRWEKAVPGIFESSANYDLLEANVQHSINLGVMRSFRYNITAGWFPNTAVMHFSDLKHFNTKPFYYSSSAFSSGFRLAPVYSMSEMNRYLTVDARYSAPFLLLKYLPLLDRSMILENLYLSFIGTSKIPAYTEIGYGLSNIFLQGELGVYVGFNRFEYHSVGVKIGFDLASGTISL